MRHQERINEYLKILLRDAYNMDVSPGNYIRDLLDEIAEFECDLEKYHAKFSKSRLEGIE